jgi:hypothetical protein
MTLDHFASFNQDNVDDVVRNYADPFVEANVTGVPRSVVIEEARKQEEGDKIISDDGGDFIVVEVKEFEEIPVICRKSYALNGKVFLRKGAIYTRSRGKSETAEVHTQTEMREIINIAVDKNRLFFIERMTGILTEILEHIQPKPSDEQKYDKQLPNTLER